MAEGNQTPSSIGRSAACAGPEVKHLKLCPSCRRKLVPQRVGLVGAWYCTSCEWAYTQIEVETFVDNCPGGVTHIGPRS